MLILVLERGVQIRFFLAFQCLHEPFSYGPYFVGHDHDSPPRTQVEMELRRPAWAFSHALCSHRRHLLRAAGEWLPEVVQKPLRNTELCQLELDKPLVLYAGRLRHRVFFESTTALGYENARL